MTYIQLKHVTDQPLSNDLKLQSRQGTIIDTKALFQAGVAVVELGPRLTAHCAAEWKHSMITASSLHR